jgi:hypothetical protein
MACPVCFGDSNEPMALATNYGIWFMLGIVAVMLSAFATFFIHLMRRARLAAQPPSSGDGSYIRGQEGTA